MTTNDNAAPLTDWDIARGGQSLHVEWLIIDGALVAHDAGDVVADAAADVDATLVMRAPMDFLFDECA